MPSPPLWCEARCDGLYDPGVIGCHQTAPGGFGVKEGTAMAKLAGWRVAGSEWLCPACYTRRTRCEEK